MEDIKEISKQLDRLEALINEPRKNIEIEVCNQTICELKKSKSKLWFRIKKGTFEAINCEDIIMIKSAEHYNSIHIKDKKHAIIVKATLKTEIYEKYFSSFQNFFLLDRGTILNGDYVFKIAGSQIFTGVNPSQVFKIRIPRGKKIEVLKWLKIED